MSVLSNISSVAKYESKLLKRSWFFRIFIVVAVLFFFGFNFGFLVNKDNNSYWIMRALFSNIPYVNLLLLNAAQAIIAVFLSSEFLKADKKLDTSEVFYVHPLSNAEYVFGKILGNMNVFIQLNLIIIAIVVVMNYVSGVSIDWLAYITYFLIITVPTLIYIFGLSIGMMLIIKNQAITFVLLLGYIALTLFYISDSFYYLFDYMAYSFPLVKSSVVGFTNWSVLVNHRFIYLLIGFGFICISIFLFKRLPNTKYGRYRWLAFSFCFILVGFAAGFKHVNTFVQASKMRTLYTDINNKYVSTPQMLIENYDIKVEQHPKTISATVVMHGTAQESASVFTFCLNPSLKVSEIKENGRNLSFTREHQIIFIDFGRVLQKGDRASWEIAYSGSIDENFCYLDIPDELLQEKYAVEQYFSIDKKYSFQTENYVLFTPETYWYPRSGVAYSSENPDWQRAYFSNYRLEVKTMNGLQAISQGTRKLPVEKVPTIRSNEFNSDDGFGFRPMGGGGMRGGAMFMGVAPGGMGGMAFFGSGGGGNVTVTTGRQGGGQGQGNTRQQGQGGGDFRAISTQGGNARPQGQDGQDGEARRTRMREGMDTAAMRRMREGMDTAAMRRMREGGVPQGGNARPQRIDGQGSPQDGNARPQRIDGQGSPQGGNARPQRIDGQGSPQGGNARPQRIDGQGNPQDGNARPQRIDGQGGPQGDERRPRMREDGDSIRRFFIGEDAIAEVPHEMTTDSIFIFETDFSTPGISLIIGDYEQRCIEVDHTIYNMWHLKGNDFFAASFDSIADTIPYQIRMRRHALETQYSLNYSFKRFSVVEVPVQFSGYVRTWTQAQETIQPEMVLFPEKGCLFNELDVVRQMRWQKSWAKRQGRELSDIAAALTVFNNFLMTFQRAESRGGFSMERGAMNISTTPNPYFIFPQLYNFRYNIYSSEWSIANRLIELYLQDMADNNWMRQMNGISNNEKANLLIQKHPFKELLSNTEHRNLLNNVISLKANTLFAPAEQNLGNAAFRDSIRAFLYDRQFTNISFDYLLDAMSLIAEEDLSTPLATWDSPTKLPAYIVGTPEITYIINRDVEVYVVKLQITNDSDYDGIINVETLFGGGMMGGGGVSDDPRTKRKISLAARETKLLVTVWDEAPRAINVNTLISANLPNMINLPLNNIVRERNVPIDEEGDFILANVNYTTPGEVIVDNEDKELFELSHPDIVGLLPQWLDQIGDDSFPYSGVQSWRPPLQWTLTTNDKYYGTHIRSAYAIKSGNGNQTATWKVPVPEKGLYDLFYYITLQDDQRNRSQNNRGGNNSGSSGKMEYHLKVQYDNDVDHAYINLRRAEDGWNRVGAYYFSEDTIKVVLSNDIANVRMVTADAVKIVKRETSTVSESRIEN